MRVRRVFHARFAARAHYIISIVFVFVDLVVLLLFGSLQTIGFDLSGAAVIGTCRRSMVCAISTMTDEYGMTRVMR